MNPSDASPTARVRCLRCGRVADDLVHDNPNDHGWTGCATMHPFVDAHGKTLLQWAARAVALQGRVGQKKHAPDPQYADWNRVIGVAEAAVERMFAPISAEELAAHDKYFKKEYAEAARAAGPSAGEAAERAELARLKAKYETAGQLQDAETLENRGLRNTSRKIEG